MIPWKPASSVMRAMSSSWSVSRNATACQNFTGPTPHRLGPVRRRRSPMGRWSSSLPHWLARFARSLLLHRHRVDGGADAADERLGRGVEQELVHAVVGAVRSQRVEVPVL